MQSNFKPKKIRFPSTLSQHGQQLKTHKYYESNNGLQENLHFTEFGNNTSQKQISTKLANRLHEWLNAINMGQYFDNFLSNGIYDINQIIQNMNTNDRLYFEDIFNIGILKPGHIYKILTQLEIDSNLISEKIYYALFNFNNCVNNRNSLQSLRISSEKYVCCRTNSLTNVRNKKSKISTDLVEFLRKVNQVESRKNFIYNGFESIEYIYLQMFSFYPITDTILKENFHLYDRNARDVIIKQLNEGKNIIIYL